MLQHVFEVHRVQRIFAGVNVRAVVFEAALENKRARVSVAVRGRMVGAAVAALGAHVADVAVLLKVSMLRFMAEYQMM